MSRRSWNIENIKQWIEENAYGYQIIDTEYNFNKKLHMKCPNGHDFYLKWTEFCNVGRRCKYCSIDTYDDIKHFIDSENGNGCLLITSLKEFEEEKIKQGKTNSNVKIQIQCGCINKTIFITNFIKFRDRNKRQCNKCGLQRGFNKHRHSGLEAYQSFIDNDCTPLFQPEEYKRNDITLPYICNKHPNKGIQYKLPFQTSGCYECGREKTRGKNHYEWKGGISSINEYLRRHLVTWRKDSMKFNQYKCVLTGSRFDDIHHLYGFDLIAKQIFNMDIIPIKQVNEYTEEELLIIEKQCIDLNYKYGFGICLSKSIHLLYHKYYSENESQPQQFWEFVKRLELGDFDEYLDQNNLVLNINYGILNKLLAQFNLKI